MLKSGDTVYHSAHGQGIISSINQSSNTAIVQFSTGLQTVSISSLRGVLNS